MIKIETKQKGW